MQLEPGGTVRCVGGEAGVVADLVIDPRTCRITHVVVKPRHDDALARLVPIELAARGVVGGPEAGGRRSVVVLRCTASEMNRLPQVLPMDVSRHARFERPRGPEATRLPAFHGRA